MVLSFLETALQQNHLVLSDKIQSQFLHYLNLLIKWNRVYNLTAIDHPKEMVYLHLIDSLIISPYLKGKNHLDVGSGAGFPGVPLAILNPDTHWVLLDKNNKKIRFLTQVIAELKLTHVEAIHSRAEDFHPTACFDSILSRAYAHLDQFVLTTKHLLCTDGIFIAMKGKYPAVEIASLPPSVRVEEVTPLQIKGINVERHLVTIKIDKEDSSWEK